MFVGERQRSELRLPFVMLSTCASAFQRRCKWLQLWAIGEGGDSCLVARGSLCCGSGPRGGMTGGKRLRPALPAQGSRCVAKGRR